MKDKKLLTQTGPPDLASRIREGDNRAFAAVHNQYKTKLFFYLKQMVDEWHEVEDLVSDTFMALWTSREKIQSEKHIRNFLFLTARHKALDYLKAKERRGTIVDEMELPDKADEDILETELAEAIMVSRLKEAVNALPADYRRIFELSFEMERNSSEIARILQTTPGTVRSQKKRTLEMIHKWIKKNTPGLIVILCLLSGYWGVFKKIFSFLPH